MAGRDHSLCRRASERGLRVLDDPPSLHRYPRASSVVPMVTPASGADSRLLAQLLRETEKVNTPCLSTRRQKKGDLCQRLACIPFVEMSPFYD